MATLLTQGQSQRDLITTWKRLQSEEAKMEIILSFCQFNLSFIYTYFAYSLLELKTCHSMINGENPFTSALYHVHDQWKERD